MVAYDIIEDERSFLSLPSF